MVMSIGLDSLYAYLYCIVLSRVLTDAPLLGGAMYLCGRVTTLWLDGYFRSKLLGRRWRIAGSVVLAIMLVINLLELLFLPTAVGQRDVWLLFTIILTMTLRDMLGRRLVRASLRRKFSEAAFRIAYASLQFVLHVTGASLLLGSLSGAYAWMMALGYLLSSVLECNAQLRERRMQHSIRTLSDTPEDTLEQMTSAHAFVAYEIVCAAVVAAQQVTLVVMYTFLAITAEELLKCLLIGIACMVIAREVTEHLIRRRKKRVEPINVLILGLFLWLYGIIVFRGLLQQSMPDLASAYFCMGVCTAGVTVCSSCLNGLESAMHAVTRFATGRDDRAAMQAYHRAAGNLAVLGGQLLALAGLTLLYLFGPDLRFADFSQVALTFRPLMVAPALLTVVVALLAALRFPLSERYAHKLQRFLQISDNGADNPALRRQLERVLLSRHTQPLFVRFLMALLRPFYRHTLQNADLIVQDESNPTVFLCNHGEFYGPVVGVLHIPVPIRAWVIADIMIDKDETAEYVHRFTISRQKWLPERWKMPIARLVGRLSVMVMNQLETIPVYRNKLTQLKTTFRLSVEAMEAGDNLLVFPENPDADPENPGYVREGVGEFFAGFVMLAQVYYAKTGKCCRFQPLFAHKGMRTMTFCEPIVYQPDNDPIAERDRIVAYAKAEMERVYEAEEARYHAKHRESGAKEHE